MSYFGDGSLAQEILDTCKTFNGNPGDVIDALAKVIQYYADSIDV